MPRVAKMAKSLALVGPLSAVFVTIPAAGAAVAAPTATSDEGTAASQLIDEGSVWNVIPVLSDLSLAHQSQSRGAEELTSQPKLATKSTAVSLAQKAISKASAPATEASTELPSAPEEVTGSASEAPSTLAGPTGSSVSGANADDAPLTAAYSPDVFLKSVTGGGKQQVFCTDPLPDSPYVKTYTGGAAGLLLQVSRPVVDEESNKLVGWEGKSLLGPVTVYAVCEDEQAD